MIASDDVVKLVLAFSVAFAIVVIAMQLARLLGEITGGVKDARRLVRNAGDVSDLMVQDYSQVRKFVGSFVNIRDTFPKIWGLLRPGSGKVESDTDESET